MGSVKEFLLSKGLPEWVASRVSEAFGSLEELAKTPPEVLAEKCGIDRDLAAEITRLAAKEAIEFMPALELTKRAKRLLKFRVRSLDNLLGGGLPEGSLVMIYGEPGVGKTQTALQLSVNVQLPEREGGFDSGAVYLDTEGGFSAVRVAAMARAKGIDPDLALRRIMVARVRTVEALYVAIEKSAELVRSGEAGLVVVDSLLAPFRAEYRGLNMLPARQQTMARMLGELSRLADLGAVCVITNHVIGKMSPLRRYGPAGGYTLGHAPDPILKIRRSVGNRRIMSIEDSSCLPPGEALFAILPEGLADVGEFE
ncbi:MAG TPA: hypothetical protein ENG69_03565 [Candidatus Korarchaeota archaeon]|nr:hypothetical protein [Candidatus Korarchaeota archaeon]